MWREGGREGCVIWVIEQAPLIRYHIKLDRMCFIILFVKISAAQQVLFPNCQCGGTSKHF